MPTDIEGPAGDSEGPDFSCFARKPSERLAIVEHILDTPGLEETLYLEWKSGYDLSTRPGAAATAKQLIGMANRDPAEAGRFAEGYAYVLLGVGPGVLPGVPHWDSADIENWLSRFVQDELRYQVFYVSRDEKEILFLVVEPPRPGDPVFCLQNASQEPEATRAADDDDSEERGKNKSLPRGAIYVRHGGKTEQHTPDDLRRLVARANVAQAATALDLRLECDGSQLVVNDPGPLDEPFRDSALQKWRTAMLAALPECDDDEHEPDQQYDRPWDIRSVAEYTRAIDIYVAQATTFWPEIVALRALLASGSRLQITVANNSDENYEDLVIEVFLGLGDGHVHPDLDHARAVLPVKPRRWRMEPALDSIERAVRPSPAGPKPEIEQVGNHMTLVRFPEFRLRPHSNHRLQDIYIHLASTDVENDLPLRWRATASNKKGDQQGTLELSAPDRRIDARQIPMP